MAKIGHLTSASQLVRHSTLLRKIDIECCSLPGRIHQLDISSVIPYNAMHNRQPHICPLPHIFGSEIRVKDLVFDFRVDAMSGVAYGLLRKEPGF